MKFYTRRRKMPTVIIVSLIDIFVILLIFVIVTTTFKREQPSVVIRLPESSQSEMISHEEQQKLVVLTVSKEGVIALDARVIEGGVEELASHVKPLVEANYSLALRADTEAPFGVILRVTDALKESGIKGNLPAFTELKKR